MKTIMKGFNFTEWKDYLTMDKIIAYKRVFNSFVKSFKLNTHLLNKKTYDGVETKMVLIFSDILFLSIDSPLILNFFERYRR